MAVLVREDGINFVLRAYRERLAPTKRSLLIQRIRLFAEQHGQYAYLSTVAGEQTLEIAFSSSPGYLLGEILWNHVGKPRYLIFCERLQNENKQLLVVVVRDGSIYLDAQLPDDELASELLPVLTSSQAFRIITSGDVPISIEIKPENFTLPTSLISSFETLAEPIFPTLPVSSEFQLQPLAKILSSKLLGQQISWPIVIPAIALVILLLVWWFYPSPPEQPYISTIIAKPLANPYEQYFQSLDTPGPATVIEQLVICINKTSLLPGWQATSYNYDSTQYQISLSRLGGNTKWLTKWSKAHHFQINLAAGSAQIQYKVHLPARGKPKQIFRIQQVLSLIDDKLEQLVGDDAFVLGESVQQGDAKKIPVTINLTGVSTPLLTLIGQILGDDLPISIDRINLNQQDSNLLSGSIQLSVWGK